MMWMSANPWAALEGTTIPNHSLDAPPLGPRSPSGGINYGSGARQLRTVDRSRAFPGASSNLTTRLPSSSVPLRAPPIERDGNLTRPTSSITTAIGATATGGAVNGVGDAGEGPAGIASFPRWSLGSIYLVSGYGLFRNPFVSNVAHQSFLDYSKPIEDIEDDDEPAANSTSADAGGTPANDPTQETAEDRLKYLVRTPEVRAGLKAFDAADQAFKDKNYEFARQKSDKPSSSCPTTRRFTGLGRSFCSPAGTTSRPPRRSTPCWPFRPAGTGRRSAAGTPIRRNFRANSRDLEGYHKGHPDSAAAAFLRGYHYTTCRHFEAAVKQLQNAIRLLPDDDLLPALGAPSAAIEANTSGNLGRPAFHDSVSGIRRATRPGQPADRECHTDRRMEGVSQRDDEHHVEASRRRAICVGRNSERETSADCRPIRRPGKPALPRWRKWNPRRLCGDEKTGGLPVHNSRHRPDEQGIGILGRGPAGQVFFLERCESAHPRPVSNSGCGRSPRQVAPQLPAIATLA